VRWKAFTLFCGKFIQDTAVSNFVRIGCVLGYRRHATKTFRLAYYIHVAFYILITVEHTTVQLLATSYDVIDRIQLWKQWIKSGENGGWRRRHNRCHSSAGEVPTAAAAAANSRVDEVRQCQLCHAPCCDCSIECCTLDISMRSDVGHWSRIPPPRGHFFLLTSA